MRPRVARAGSWLRASSRWRCCSLLLAGDTLDDANFERKTADAMILRLYIELEWMLSVTKGADAASMRPASDPYVYWDHVLLNRINDAIVGAERGYRR